MFNSTNFFFITVLLQRGQLNTSSIAQRLGTNYETTFRNLAFLEKEGIIEHRRSGKTRFFRFSNTVKAKATIKLLDEW
jgi:DNA-binding MarR family transcriptional regulator